MILIAAGGLKLLTGVVPETSAVTSLLMPDWTLAVTPVFELALGGWLLADRWRFGAWLTTVLTLVVFSLHNLELVAAGQRSCACLGPVSPTPGIMLGLDVAALALLLKQRPGWRGWPTDTPALRLVGTTAGVVTLTLGLVAGGVYARYGSMTLALADVRGEPVVALPRPLSVPPVDNGTLVTLTVQLINLTGEEVTVSGARADCSCAEFPNLPLTLAPGGQGEAQIALHTPRRAVGPYRRQVAFETSVGLVPLTIHGTGRGGPVVGELDPQQPPSGGTP